MYRDTVTEMTCHLHKLLDNVCTFHLPSFRVIRSVVSSRGTALAFLIGDRVFKLLSGM
jgi:hypothetical protein